MKQERKYRWSISGRRKVKKVLREQRRLSSPPILKETILELTPLPDRSVNASKIISKARSSQSEFTAVAVARIMT